MSGDRPVSGDCTVSGDCPEDRDFLADARWRLTATPAGSCGHPKDLPAESEWLDAVVPGTVAVVVDTPEQDDLDWWYVTTVALTTNAPTTLRFDGIATHSAIWIDGVEAARTRSMFVPESIELDGRSADVEIAVRIESMNARLKSRRPRGRWRSSLIAQQGLRHERTTFLGRAPVYGQLAAPAGLWRPVTLRPRARVADVRLHTSVDGTTGTVRVRGTVVGSAASVVLALGDTRFSLAADGHVLDSSVPVPDVALWWPHTHGDPTLYPWSLEVDGTVVDSGRIGFRSAVLTRADRAVTLHVNGVRVFARGGCWVPLDPTRLWVDEGVLRRSLEQVRDAGLNMVRVVGTMVYEQTEFWSLCAELGIMVWQDIMFATVDPPEDAEFVDAVVSEVTALTALVGGNPALAVISGGSETQQQPTMLGVPESGQRMTLLQNVLPDLVDTELPGTSYVTSSPSSTTGELHTHVGDGIAHYFGVGGYLRPLDNVRTARVRFAAECLAFAIPPERRAVDRMFGSANVAGHHPDWKAAVPRDRGSSWDFEDVRDHYVREIFGVDPHQVRRNDAELYLDYGRAAVCDAATYAFMHWRRTDSECAGALVLTLGDLVPGAGWGFRDSDGAPKAPWYSLARVSRPVAIYFVDDGMDGLTIELIDDTANPITGTLRVALHGVSTESHEYPIDVRAHGALSLSLDRLLGVFTDVNHAYRFGGQTYTAVTAELVDASGTVVADATHLIGDRHARQNDVGLSAIATPDGPGRWALSVRSDWAAHYVCVDVDGFEVSDSWFHLAPGRTRTVTLLGDRPKPTGHVRALNSIRKARID